MPCASFSMLDGPGGTGSYEVCFPVHSCLGSRDVGVVGVFDCHKQGPDFDDLKILFRINLPLFFTVVPSIICMFLSCRPFVVITTL